MLADQWEEVDEEVSITSDDVERSTAQIHKLLKPLTRCVTTVDDVRHIRRQHEWSTVTDNHHKHSRT